MPECNHLTPARIRLKGITGLNSGSDCSGDSSNECHLKDFLQLGDPDWVRRGRAGVDVFLPAVDPGRDQKQVPDGDEGEIGH